MYKDEVVTNDMIHTQSIITMPQLLQKFLKAGKWKYHKNVFPLMIRKAGQQKKIIPMLKPGVHKFSKNLEATSKF
jgi:hypothetical protein